MKWKASRISSQRIIESHIINGLRGFSEVVISSYFEYCTLSEYNNADERLRQRFSTSTIIQNTR